ncbi:hypothetical protein COOONC_16078 [Cooperia oncophora]
MIESSSLYVDFKKLTPSRKGLSRYAAIGIFDSPPIHYQQALSKTPAPQRTGGEGIRDRSKSICDTITMTFSITKAVSAVCIALLADRGTSEV